MWLDAKRNLNDIDHKLKHLYEEGTNTQSCPNPPCPTILSLSLHVFEPTPRPVLEEWHKSLFFVIPPVNIRDTPSVPMSHVEVFHCNTVLLMVKYERNAILLSSMATLKSSFLSHSWCVSIDGLTDCSDERPFVFGLELSFSLV